MDAGMAEPLITNGLFAQHLGYAGLAEIRAVHGPLWLPVECDLHFTAEHPLSRYVQHTRQSGMIVAD